MIQWNPTFLNEKTHVWKNVCVKGYRTLYQILDVVVAIVFDDVHYLLVNDFVVPTFLLTFAHRQFVINSLKIYKQFELFTTDATNITKH